MTEYVPFLGGSVKTALPTDLTSSFYADNVVTCIFSPYVVKMQFVRNDISLSNDQEFVNSIVGQVTMPIEGFLATFLFFVDKIEEMKKNGLVTDEMINARRDRAK